MCVVCTSDIICSYFNYLLSYDDVVVGAPMYSKANLPELGRFFILYNNRVG